MILIGIPCYNGADTLLPACLESIRTRSGAAVDYDLVVVDDSGRDEHRRKSRAVAERFGARWLSHDRNRGIPAGWNTIARSSNASMIALLNDDIIVSKGWLDALVYFLQNNAHAGSVGLHFNFIVPDDVRGLLADPDAAIPTRDPFTKEPQESSHDPSGTIGLCMCPPGCCFGFTRERYDEVGGFDEGYFCFYEESDFGTALAARGYPTYLMPWPTLGHIWSATFSAAPELKATSIMDASRERYKKKWGGDFDYTNPLFMPRCTPALTKWLTPSGPREELR